MDKKKNLSPYFSLLYPDAGELKDVLIYKEYAVFALGDIVTGMSGKGSIYVKIKSDLFNQKNPINLTATLIR